MVFSQTPEEHVPRLKVVFNKLRAAGLKIKPSKCDLFKKEIKYLGHVVMKGSLLTLTKSNLSQNGLNHYCDRG